MKYVLYSPFFKNGEEIPQKYTCDGENISPELVWENPPVGTNSFVLLMNDYDSSSDIRNHWIVYNVPKNTSKIQEGATTLPAPAKIGMNSEKIKRYSGPCPSDDREHRFSFKLYALDSLLNLRHRASSENIEKIIRPHIIEVAELICTYKRKVQPNSIAPGKKDFEDASTILRRKDVNQDIKAKAKKEIEELSLKPDKP